MATCTTNSAKQTTKATPTKTTSTTKDLAATSSDSSEAEEIMDLESGNATKQKMATTANNVNSDNNGTNKETAVRNISGGNTAVSRSNNPNRAEQRSDSLVEEINSESGGSSSTIYNPSLLPHPLPRLVLRNRPFFQSANKLHIQHNKRGFKILSLLQYNWFHYFLRWPTKFSLLTLMSIWTGAILVFAFLYMVYDRMDSTVGCQLGVSEDEYMTFGAAFAFSLETCTTVGYGLPHGINGYFEQGCQTLQVVIYFQMAWSMLFNAFLITFIYNRIGRSEARGAQVIYSQKALVSFVNDQIRFQIRIFDADAKHPVVEAHVRLYCVLTQRPVPRPLRLLQPDDELGGVLFLSFPTVVSHNIDLYSLLHPPVQNTSAGFGGYASTSSLNTLNGDSSRSSKIGYNSYYHNVQPDPSGLILRQVDGTTASRDDVICPICGESYGTMERWTNHVRFQQIVETKDEYPIEGTHRSLDLNEIIKSQQQQLQHVQAQAKPSIEQQDQQDISGNTEYAQRLNELKAYFDEHVSEIICVVEGIDPMQSGTFQALHSYRSEDIVWNAHAQFAPCLKVVAESKNSKKKRVNQQRSVFEVDLDRYHDWCIDHDAVFESQQRHNSHHNYYSNTMIDGSRVGSSGREGSGREGSGRGSSILNTSGHSSRQQATQQQQPRQRRRYKKKSTRIGDSLFSESEEPPTSTADEGIQGLATIPAMSYSQDQVDSIAPSPSSGSGTASNNNMTV